MYMWWSILAVQDVDTVYICLWGLRSGVLVGGSRVALSWVFSALVQASVLVAAWDSGSSVAAYFIGSFVSIYTSDMGTKQV